MNDGSDGTTTPSTNWKTNVDRFINLCQTSNICPIFATIPSTPTIDHSKKNAWIRQSGYRYIDFEKAVGADINSQWYVGSRDSGNHSTEKGAKEMAFRFILDLPEATLTNF